MAEGLELLKASVPLATLTGVVVGALLNSKLARKEKIRDHLFTYKVKSYSTLAECIVGVKRDMQNKKSKIRVKREDDAKTITDVWEDFRKVADEQTLFLSDQTKHDLFILEGDIFEAFNMEIERIIDKDNFSDEEIMDMCEKVANNCEDFILKLQDELGISAVNKKMFN